MVQPANGTPGLIPGEDYVDIPGVDPITPASFAPGTPPNQLPAPDNRLAQWQAMQNQPVPVDPRLAQWQAQQPPASTAGAGAGAGAGAPQAIANHIGSPASPNFGGFGTSPLGPQQGLAADAQVFANIADNYRKTGDAIGQGKYEEAAKHDSFAREQELNIGQSNKDWNAAQADQVRREKAMDLAIAKGRALSVDPDNYWNRKGTASSILAAISVGLGSFGSGMTHGATGNPALTLVNNAIEHDISSQKDNIENYWRTVSQQGHLDDNAFNRSLITQNLQANMRLAGYKVYESDLKTIQAKSDSQVVKLGAQKQIDDLQLAMNAQRKQLAANIAAQQSAGAALVNKDSEGFNKDVMEYMKEHPGLSPQEAAKDIAAINPARTSRLGARSALPTDAQDDFVYSREKSHAASINPAIRTVIDHNIADYEKRTGHPANDMDRKAIEASTTETIFKQHPEFGQFKFFKPSVDGSLIDIRKPVEVGSVPSAVGVNGPDRRSKEQIAEDKKRETFIEIPVTDKDGKVQIGDDGQPITHKIKALAISPKAAEDYTKWSNIEPTIKTQMNILKDALAKGDRPSYEAARGLIIESLPAIYGFERAPTEGQIHTTFAGAIPEWQTVRNIVTDSGAAYFMTSQLAVAEKALNSLSLSKRTNTFGPDAGRGLTVGDYNRSGENHTPISTQIEPTGSPLSVGRAKRTVINGKTYIQDPNTGTVTVEQPVYGFKPHSAPARK